MFLEDMPPFLMRPNFAPTQICAPLIETPASSQPVKTFDELLSSLGFSEEQALSMDLRRASSERFSEMLFPMVSD